MRVQDVSGYCKTIASLLPKVLQGGDDDAPPIAIAYRWAEASTPPAGIISNETISDDD
jgi:hypothetical protein